MPRTILIVDFHLGVRAPRGLLEPEYEAMRRALDDPRFQADLRRAVRAVVGDRPDLAHARLVLSR